jgi:hypothetical protein
MANIVDNLLGGILGSKNKDSGKKGKYFLELNEEDPKPKQVAAKVEAAVSQAADAVKPKVEAAVSKVADVADAAKPKVEAAVAKVESTVSEAADKVKPQVEAAASKVADTVKSKEKKSKRTSVKDKAPKTAEAQAQPAPVADPLPAATAKAAKPVASEIKTFAPNYWNAAFNSTSRRRPGPSLDPFKNMAKDMGPRR